MALVLRKCHKTYFSRFSCVANNLFRTFHNGIAYNHSSQIPSEKPISPRKSLSAGTKYKSFDERASPVILDSIEENFQENVDTYEEYDEFEGINLKRGLTGVFDIEDLVDLLRRENAQDVFVAAFPPDFKYFDYLCVATGKSKRHSLALAEFIKRIYKKKRSNKDAIPKIEGKNSREWIALDLGNIALHIFEESARRTYDLESLWAVGPEFDTECNKTSEALMDFAKHNLYLKDLIPLNDKTPSTET